MRLFHWSRNFATVSLELWELLHNSDFKPLEFEGFRRESGLNAFTLSPRKWIEAVGAIGIVSIRFIFVNQISNIPANSVLDEFFDTTYPDRTHVRQP